MHILYYFLFAYYFNFATPPFDNQKIDNILFIGHAYGNTEDYDDKMDSSVINFLNNFSTEKYKYIVWGGDFIYDCNNVNEIDNFINTLPLEVSKKSLFIWGNHEFICYNNDVFEFIRRDENKVIKLNGYDLYFLNTNFNNFSEVESLSKKINLSKKKILFSHQVIFSKSNWFLRTNSRDNYELANLFFEKLYLDKNLTIVSADVGAIRGTPFLSFYKKNNANLLSSGLGNGKRNYAIEIKVGMNSLQFIKLNLDNNKAKELKPRFFPITLYNAVYYFFLSKKRTVVFLAIVVLVILIWKRKKLFKQNFTSLY